MSGSAGQRAAAAVDSKRLWDRHLALGELGATPKGGVCRLALGAEELAARRMFVEYARAAGFDPATDDAGNLFARRAGTDPSAAPVLSGSHLDSQPTGGRFDGTYGVLAALEALEAMSDAGVETRRPVEAVAWTNEEGARFQPGTMGSGLFVGAIALGALGHVVDTDGDELMSALAAALAATPELERRAFGTPVAGYVEAHIEQGPLLENAGSPIGVVTGIQGIRWFDVVVTGREGHAGTTPHAQRADALVSALELVRALAAHFDDGTERVRYTVGCFDVSPSSPNTIPGRVRFTIDLRHPDADYLRVRGDAIEEVAARVAGPCSVVVTETMGLAPVAFDGAVVDLVERAARELSLPSMRLLSGAGHDAGHLARHCPSGMIFVPCAGGLSHNEEESATPSDLAAGARVLAHVLCELAE